jgi:N-acetylglucosaminyldiphosphoundecaprenol N-acetyl-beta-D-mannosaminyltransferase
MDLIEIETEKIGQKCSRNDFPGFVNILGVKVNMLNLEKTVEVMDYWIQNEFHNYICVAAVSTIMACQRSRLARKCVNQAGLVTSDGMPLVWLGRIYGFDAQRVYGPDLMLYTCEKSVSKGYSHYFYGGLPGVPERLAYKLCQRFPGLNVAGTCSPPFRKMTPDEDRAIIKQINQANPDILWVGLSSPKQDLWMAKHLGKIKAPVMIGVGAAFDFHSGSIRQAPLWMQHSGLEWAFRLFQEPRRLWRRYLFDNPAFVMYVLLQLMKVKSFPV